MKLLEAWLSLVPRDAKPSYGPEAPTRAGGSRVGGRESERVHLQIYIGKAASTIQ